MPILAPEPFVYPECLLRPDELPGELLADEEERRWWVLHTRPRAEKSLARVALEKEVPFFLPIYTRRWQKSGRTFVVTLPLFPGYFFLRGNERERHKLLATRFVSGCLPVNDQFRLQVDLERLYDLIGRGVTLTPEERLSPGTRIRITDGPMRGMEGKVLRAGTRLRLVVEVEFLKRGVSVEIEDWMVAALPDESGILVRA